MSISFSALPEKTSVSANDEFLLVESGVSKRVKASNAFRGVTIAQDITGNIDLSLYTNDLRVICNPAADITITFSGILPSGKSIVIVNMSVSATVICAGTIVTNINRDSSFTSISNGSFQVVFSTQQCSSLSIGVGNRLYDAVDMPYFKSSIDLAAGVITSGLNSTHLTNNVYWKGSGADTTLATGKCSQIYMDHTRSAFAIATDDASTVSGGSPTLTDKFCFTHDGRMYGRELHNNPNAVTGHVNQYIASGTYTPNLTININISSPTAGVCQWLRVGNVVTVSGKIRFTTPAASSAILGVDLPIPSNFTSITDLGGSAVQGTASQVPFAIYADSINNRMTFQAISTNTSALDYSFNATYVIL